MKILLVEDDRKLCGSISILIENEGYLVECCHDGSDGLYYAMTSSFDLIILDIMLPSMDGFEVLRRLREKGILTPILLLTAKNTIEDKVTGLNDGADDYLAKPFHAEELTARVRALLRRPAHLQKTSHLLQFHDISLDTNDRILMGNGSSTLTKKETMILELLMRNPDQTVSREMIFQRAWDDASAFDSNLDAYIYLIRKKLKQISKDTSIKTIHQQGYSLVHNGGTA